MSGRAEAERAERGWQGALRALAREPRSSELVLEALGAAGRLLLAGGDPDGVANLLGSVQIDRTLGADALEASAIAALDGIEGQDAPAMIEALELRHEIEARVIALEELGAPVRDDAREAMRVFDELVRPHAWRLVRWNVEREQRARAIAPIHRARCWWWCAGNGLDPRSVELLEAVALLAARFVEAEEALERAIATAQTWTRTARTLGAWARTARSGLLVETSHVRVSWEPPATLIVDLEEAPLRPPTLRIGEHVHVAERTAGAHERYRFAVDPDAKEADLVLPLSWGTRSFVLPPRCV